MNNTIESPLYIPVTMCSQTPCDPHKHTGISDEEQAPNCAYKEREHRMSSRALDMVQQCMAEFGDSAAQDLEAHMEVLQDAFLAHLNTLLHARGLALEEKIILSLSQHNTLFLECEGDEEIFLNALGDDTELVARLCLLRSAALMQRALQFFLESQTESVPDHMPQYKVCAKGQLSHFYLKDMA